MLLAIICRIYPESSAHKKLGEARCDLGPTPVRGVVVGLGGAFPHGQTPRPLPCGAGRRPRRLGAAQDCPDLYGRPLATARCGHAAVIQGAGDAAVGGGVVRRRLWGPKPIIDAIADAEYGLPLGVT